MPLTQNAHNPIAVYRQTRREQLLRKPVASEDELQIACIELYDEFWAYQIASELHHSPNGGSRHKMTGKNGQTFSLEAQKLQRMGVMPGRPDLELNYEGGRTLFIELKYGKNTLSAKQKAVHERLRALGFTVVVCRTVEEFDLALQELFNQA